jgi:hypothetical protein
MRRTAPQERLQLQAAAHAGQGLEPTPSSAEDPPIWFDFHSTVGADPVVGFPVGAVGVFLAVWAVNQGFHRFFLSW